MHKYISSESLCKNHYKGEHAYNFIWRGYPFLEGIIGSQLSVVPLLLFKRKKDCPFCLKCDMIVTNCELWGITNIFSGAGRGGKA